ncbi:UNVERIFIED_CONTAM: hypothetical protein RMT77_005489 [Armadillidium vulgare]
MKFLKLLFFVCIGLSPLNLELRFSFACSTYECEYLDNYFYGTTDSYWSWCDSHYWVSPCYEAYACCYNECSELVCYEPMYVPGYRPFKKPTYW